MTCFLDFGPPLHRPRYIGGKGKDDPELWNVYNRTLNGQARTNNAVEAWHRGISSNMGCEHPTLWKFLNKLKSQQQHRDKVIEGLIAGRAPPQKRRKYADLDQRIITVVRDFGNRNSLDYLRGIAHNLTF